MHNGYILLWRKSLDSMVWKDRKLWRLWTWLLLSARWRPGRDLLGRKPVDLGPGELLATTEGLAQATGLTVKEVRSALALGCRVGVLRSEGTAWGTRITIVNWQDYQGHDAATGKTKAAARGQLRGGPQPPQGKRSDKAPGEPPGGPSGAPGADAGQTPGQPSPYAKKGTREGMEPPATHLATGPVELRAERAAGAGPASCLSVLEGQAALDCQRFLDAYPKKAAQEAARALWAEMAAAPAGGDGGAQGLPPLDELLAALARHCASPAWAVEGGRFIPTPANWLARRSWTGLATGLATGPAAGSAIDRWLAGQGGPDGEDGGGGGP